MAGAHDEVGDDDCGDDDEYGDETNDELGKGHVDDGVDGVDVAEDNDDGGKNDDGEEESEVTCTRVLMRL